MTSQSVRNLEKALAAHWRVAPSKRNRPARAAWTRRRQKLERELRAARSAHRNALQAEAEKEMARARHGETVIFRHESSILLALADILMERFPHSVSAGTSWYFYADESDDVAAVRLSDHFPPHPRSWQARLFVFTGEGSAYAREYMTTSHYICLRTGTPLNLVEVADRIVSNL